MSNTPNPPDSQVDATDSKLNQGVAAHWSVTGPDPEDRGDTSNLVMAWAKDTETGELRYIFELGPDRRGAKCCCECYSCGLPLTAVNAGKTKWIRRPHFRHPEGAQRDACLILSARAAALEQLKHLDTLTLPARRVGESITGLSGRRYNAWISAPPEPVRIVNFKEKDKVSAILTLDDGRQLLVSLTGQIEALDGETSVPTIRLGVDDPKIAAMSPAELKSRLHLLVEQATWCGHWKDAELATQARETARIEADNALDWLDDTEFPELRAGISRETVLHLLAKNILEQEQRIRLPSLIASVELRLPRGRAEYRETVVKGQAVHLGLVTLEKQIGRTRPDVVAEIVSTSEEPSPISASPLLGVGVAPIPRTP